MCQQNIINFTIICGYLLTISGQQMNCWKFMFSVVLLHLFEEYMENRIKTINESAFFIMEIRDKM